MVMELSMLENISNVNEVRYESEDNDIKYE